VRVVVKAGFDTASGYGNDGCGIAEGLAARGHDVMLHPNGVTPPIPQAVANLLTVPLEPPFDVAIIHVDPPHLFCDDGMRATSRRVVGWTMWEWQDFKPGSRVRLNALRKNWSKLDLMLSYSDVAYEALDPLISPATEHRILQGGYWADAWRPRPNDPPRDWDGTFRFVMVGQLHKRKDPFAAITAFSRLKDRHGEAFDAELHLKNNIKTLHPSIEDAYDGVRVHYRYWSHTQMRELYLKSHCLLAPSMGEGKNVPALEAMTTGIPVIATNYSGHTTWLRDDYAYPLNWTPVVNEGGRQARADVEHLEELMWHVYQKRDEAKLKGELAARTIPAMCDWSKVLERFELTLQVSPQREVGLAL
jgi:glycosyltransferase involved in cell wall biosynthesis